MTPGSRLPTGSSTVDFLKGDSPEQSPILAQYGMLSLLQADRASVCLSSLARALCLDGLHAQAPHSLLQRTCPFFRPGSKVPQQQGPSSPPTRHTPSEPLSPPLCPPPHLNLSPSHPNPSPRWPSAAQAGCSGQQSIASFTPSPSLPIGTHAEPTAKETRAPGQVPPPASHPPTLPKFALELDVPCG